MWHIRRSPGELLETTFGILPFIEILLNVFEVFRVKSLRFFAKVLQRPPTFFLFQIFLMFILPWHWLHKKSLFPPHLLWEVRADLAETLMH
jgi:hypothetical protein